jgi:hypothetical protein
LLHNGTSRSPSSSALREKGTVARKCQTLHENAKSWGIIPHSPDEAAILMNSFNCRQSDRLLRTCPDDAPAPSTTDPAFISDADLRADLLQDLGEVNRSLHNGEWKGATVLAGSIVEALLLWALPTKGSTPNFKLPQYGSARQSISPGDQETARAVGST